MIDVDIDQIYISTSLSKENALKLDYKQLCEFNFEVTPKNEINTILYKAGMSFDELKNNISEYKAGVFIYTFLFDYKDLDHSNVYEFTKLLNRKKFFYK